MTSLLRERLIALAEPLLTQLGYELVDLEYAPGRGHAVLRLFIDRAPASAPRPGAGASVDADAGASAEGEDDGIGIEDCERVSQEFSALLDVTDPVPTGYTLEVSSPGLDRVLRTPAHFQRFVGERVWVELQVAREGRRRYTGRLEACGPEGVELSVDGAIVAVRYAEIGRARLAPEWS